MEGRTSRERSEAEEWRDPVPLPSGRKGGWCEGAPAALDPAKSATPTCRLTGSLLLGCVVRPPSRGRAQIPLTGALSKNGTADQLARLNALRKKLLREAATVPAQPTPVPRRIGEISNAISEVLADAAGPLHVAEIHGAVERLLGSSVNYRSVKACLSDGATRLRPRFQRVSYGRYKLNSPPRKLG